MKSVTRQQALVRASEIVGGFDQLAERLGMVDIILMQLPVDDTRPRERRDSTTESGQGD